MGRSHRNSLRRRRWQAAGGGLQRRIMRGQSPDGQWGGDGFFAGRLRRRWRGQRAVHTRRCAVRGVCCDGMSSRCFVIDGTNVVLAHGRARPELRYVLALGTYLRGQGLPFICFFDANMGYLLQEHASEQFDVFERLRIDPRWSASLCVVPGGTEADEWILARAKSEGADVISNDKYRRHARDHRWIWKRRHGFLAERERLLIESLGVDIPVRPCAADYL